MRGKDSGQVNGAVGESGNGTRLSGLRARRVEVIVLLVAIATLGLIAALLVFTNGLV